MQLKLRAFVMILLYVTLQMLQKGKAIVNRMDARNLRVSSNTLHVASK